MAKENKLWVQSGDSYYLRDLGVNHKILPNKIFQVDVDSFGNIFLVEVQSKFTFDYKVYGLETDLIHRILRTAKEVEGNLGVLLNGQRGTGKTVTSKLLCNDLRLPIVLVNKNIEDIHIFLNNIPQNIIIFIDEYEKIFEEDYHLLSIMDGWKDLLGQNCIIVPDYTQIPHTIAETILAEAKKNSSTTQPSPKEGQPVSTPDTEPDYLGGGSVL